MNDQSATIVEDRVLMVSSDGHATAKMRDYRPYLDRRWHEEFDEFVKVYEDVGSRNFDPPALMRRCDPETVEQWRKDMIDSDRLAGNDDPARRLIEMDREGIAAEVLFPDFGLPFELFSPFLAASMGHPARTLEQIEAGNRAYNRWVADFRSHAPERFRPMAAMSVVDVDAAVEQLPGLKEAGFGGVVVPFFSTEAPVYHSRYDRLWSTMADLGLVANIHGGMSGVRPADRFDGDLPHPALGYPIMTTVPMARELLNHLVFGGVFERHPTLQVVFTECGSGWIIGNLRQMDYTYGGSYLSSEIHEAMPLKPSEYFERQCHIGSSVFSRAEVEARHELGVDKMMIGIDYPHHEGAWNGGTLDYLQATFGVSEVPEQEAKSMLGENAVRVYDFDETKLQRVAERSGLAISDVLSKPVENKFPRGDVNKPL
jgi:predicted TIM-barrel fold metal-dependent hydrolase